MNRQSLTASSRARVIALSLLALLLMAPSEGAHVVFSVGSVEIGHGEPPLWRPAEAGDGLGAGDAVRTGHDGRAELTLASGSVRLYANSLLRLPPGDVLSGPETVRVEEGTSLFDVWERKGSRFEVHTPEVVVSIKGTRFSVSADETNSVAVYRGSVGVRQLAAHVAREMMIREGFAAIGSRGAPMELFLNPTSDPWEAWSESEPLPVLPRRAHVTLPPHQRAVFEAKAIARDAIEPELRARIEGRQSEPAKTAVTDARVRGLDRPDIERPVKQGAGSRPARDPVNETSNRALRQGIREDFVETWVNGSPVGGGVAPLFDIKPTAMGLTIDAASNTWTFSPQQLQSFADGVPLPPALQAELLGLGINDPTTFASMLLELMSNP